MSRAPDERARDGRLQLHLDNPPVNVLTIGLIESLTAELDRIAAADGALLIVRGRNGVFSAGVDVAAHASAHVDRMLESFHELIRRLWSIPQITLAVVEGVALGGGCELAAACDLVMASSDARFGQPEIDVGCFPPVAAALLPERIGHQRANEMIYLGRPMSAAAAQAAGLVNWVASPERLDAEVESVVESLAAKSAVVLRHTREAIVGARRREWEERLAAAERVYRERLKRTQDLDEGVTAFMEKRPPRWTDR